MINQSVSLETYHAADTESGFGIRPCLPCRRGVALKKVEW